MKCNSCGGGHKKCGPAMIAYVLIFVGALNWGLVGLGMLLGGKNFNLVNLIFGKMPTIEAIVYLLVGLGAVSALIGCKCKTCKEGCASCASEAK